MNWKRKEYWLVILLLVTTAVYTRLIRADQVFVDRDIDLGRISTEIDDWHGEGQTLSPKVLHVLKSDQSRIINYTNSRGNQVSLYVSYWASQKYGAQPHSPLNCVPGSGWNITSRKTIALTSDGSARAEKLIIDNSQDRQAMIFWYQTRNGILAKELNVKLQLAKNSLFRKPTDVAFIRLTTAVTDNNDAAAFKMLLDFWQEAKAQVMAGLAL